MRSPQRTGSGRRTTSTATRSFWPPSPPQGRRHFHLDHLGSPRLITDDNAVQLSVHKYFPFGAELDNGAAESPRETRQFTGHERDGAGDLHTLDYMHARYYGWGLGRFLSVDPEMDLKKTVPSPQMWNRYSYVVNNPLRYTDPDGREHVNEPGFTKPLSEAAGWADQPAVSWAFYAEGALLSEAALHAATEWAFAGLGRLAGRFIARVATAEDATRAAEGAYEAAAEGGKHAGTIENYAGRTANQITKAMRSYERQVAEHADKLRNPAKYVKEWSKLSSNEQRGLVVKWTKDMFRNAELAAVLRGMWENLRK